MIVLSSVGVSFNSLCDNSFPVFNENITVTIDDEGNKINISDFRIHDFRHSFATMCIDKGIPINIISEYLGHENVSTTMNIYGHLYSNSQDKLITMLSENQRKQDQKQDQRN